MVPKPNYKEIIAILSQFLTPIILLLTQTLTQLGIEPTVEQKFITFIVGASIGTVLMVTILFIDEMQKQREEKIKHNKELVANRVYENDATISNKMSQNDKRLKAFLNLLKNDAGILVNGTPRLKAKVPAAIQALINTL